MSNYIEFTTNHRKRTHGNPVHDGKRPKRYRDIQGIRVDGEPVEFRDPTLPERVGRYLIEPQELQRRGIANDCVAFVALMNCIELKGKRHNPFRDYDTSTSIRSAKEQLANEDPLVLVKGFHDMSKPRHIVLPAHLLLSPNYLHKLTDDEPLCMSNLGDSLKIFDCTNAHPVANVK